MPGFLVICVLYIQYLWRMIKRTVTRLFGLQAKKNTIPVNYDILYLINQKLDWHDRFFLSQTCQALRDFATCDWDDKYRSLSPKEQVKFLAGLAVGMPDHWVCGYCCALHRVDTSDTPDGSALRSLGMPCLTDPVPLMEFREYQIHHRHVQLALKYNRLGIRQKYLGELWRRPLGQST